MINKKEVSSCCGAKKMTTKMYKGEKSWCFNCGKPFLPTQEPMEWGSSLEKVSGYKFASWTSQKEIKQFISELIKQAEERAREKDYLEGYNFAREEIKLSYELFPELSAKELLEMGKIITNQ